MKSQQITKATTSTGALVLNANPKRIGVIFIGDTTTTFTVSMNPTVVANQGIVLGTTLNAVQLTKADLGDNITGPFYALSAIAGNLTIIEAMD